jgi:hypothetical protein
VSKAKATLPPIILEKERVKHLLAGTVQSRTDPETSYGVRIILDADALCVCKQCTIRGKVCPHIPALIDNLSETEVKRWVKDALRVGMPSDHEEETE